MEKHWSEEKEVIKSSKPLEIIIFLLKIFPSFLVHLLGYPISFFYVIFAKNARKSAFDYQKKLHDFTNGKIPKIISPYRQMLAFSFSIMEKFEGWLGKIKPSQIEYQNDDINDLLDNLQKNQGAFLIFSHLGNMELLRSLSENNSKLVNREVPLYVIMEIETSDNFLNALQKTNPKVNMNIIRTTDIGIETIEFLENVLKNGALVVLAGDRTSAHSRDKIIKEKFLGELANFPYGTFLLPFLLKVPVYYLFGVRSINSIFNRKFKLFIEKSKINFEQNRKERENAIKLCCKEFVEKLEKYCKKFPYQWYNFFDFWS